MIETSLLAQLGAVALSLPAVASRHGNSPRICGIPRISARFRADSILIDLLLSFPQNFEFLNL